MTCAAHVLHSLPPAWAEQVTLSAFKCCNTHFKQGCSTKPAKIIPAGQGQGRVSILGAPKWGGTGAAKQMSFVCVSGQEASTLLSFVSAHHLNA